MAKNKQKVCVIGLGYVGLPLAIRAAERGFDVYGLDTDRKKIKMINSGKSPFVDDYVSERIAKLGIKATADKKIIKKADIILICVPTPVDEKFYPILDPVINASRAVAQNLKKGALVILESTVNPGVSEEVVKPIFEKEGLKVGRDVFIAHCPERINPGKDLVSKGYDVTNIPRVVGSFDRIGLAKAKKFYEKIIDGQIMPMGTIREAEAVKIMENSFRDINIAFVNELAKSFDKMDIDITNVIRGASTKPYGFMPFWPSRGVGGHCIPVDPYYLIEKAKENNFDHKFLRTARGINNSMPLYTVDLLQVKMNEIKKAIKGSNIGILGLSYKANVGDLRESPALKIIEILKERGALLHIFDPYISEMSTVKNVQELLKKSEAIILVTNHSEFEQISPKEFKRAGIKIIIDGVNALDKGAIKKCGIIYKGIGR
ncbi:MAG: nucleotide sugar dehydrogenase [Parcubacteria group bacterium]